MIINEKDIKNSEGYVIMLGPCAERNPADNMSWDAGDPVIQEGIYKLLPELEDCATLQSIRVPAMTDAIYEAVKKCKYIIHTGTPSWYNARYRVFWKACAEYKKHISFLGIGLAHGYDDEITIGREELIALRDAGLIDFMVCRDVYCYHRLKTRLGIPNVHLLPCPAFYSLPIRGTNAKKKVVFSMANFVETSVSVSEFFKDRYFDLIKYTVDELEKRGAEVYLSYQRYLPGFPDFSLEYEQWFPKKKLQWFPLWQDFEKFFKDKDVYIGFRNHGALPCAGSGMPSLLLGTDNRQYLADEVPFISRFDISHAGINPQKITDWYYSLDPSSVSRSLVTWRGVTLDRWRPILNAIKEKIL